MPGTYLPCQPQPNRLFGQAGNNTRCSKAGNNHQLRLNYRFRQQNSCALARQRQQRSCRCEASNSNGKSSFFSALKNPLSAWFGKRDADGDKGHAEQDAQQQPGTELAKTGNDMPWTQWSAHMSAMDARARKAVEVEQDLATATAFQRFGRAAQLKKQLEELSSVDTVGNLMKEYQQAVQAEDYGKAATLRDEGAVGLAGWWVADDKEDPQGHLLHIIPGFGRYLGYAYTGLELAQAAGLPLPEEATTGSSAEESSESVSFFGTPVLELFLTKNARGELHQQGTVLSLPLDDMKKFKYTINEDNNSGSISFSKSGRNGSLAKRASVQSSRSSKGSRGSKPSTSGKLVRSADADKSNIKFMAESVERAPATIVQTGRDRLEVTVHPQSLTQTSDKATGEESDSDKEEASDSDSDNPFTTLMSSSTDDEGSDVDEEEVLGEFIASQLAQAGVHHGSVDRVELHIRRAVSDDEDDSDDDDDDNSESSRTIDVTDSSKKPSWETVVNNVLEIIKQLKQLAPEPGESKEDKAKHARLVKKLDEAEKSLTSKSVAIDKQQPQNRPKRKRELRRQQIREAVEKASRDSDGIKVKKSDGGKEDFDDQAMKILKKLMASMGMQAARKNFVLTQDEGLASMKYRRLNTDFISTDPFTGLYLGAFGSHGPEVLQLKREPDPIDDAIEWVTGTKLTGDSNVPAGEVSFKAKIGRGGRLGTPDMYPPEMGVIARYRGSGCVAQGSSLKPKWVDGELLHLSGDGATTRGAELGFVWSGNQHHFLVVLKKIDLSET